MLIPLHIAKAIRWLSMGFAVALGMTASGLAEATQAATWQTECISYFFMGVPGAVEYAAIHPTSLIVPENNWGFAAHTVPAWGSELLPEPSISDEDVADRALYISRSATVDALTTVMSQLNAAQEHEKQLMQDRVDWLNKNPSMDQSGRVRAELRSDMAAIRLYKPTASHQAIADDDGKMTTFYVLIKDRIVKARRPTLGSAVGTIDEFLKHYSARDTFSIPGEPGACLPYGFYRGEKEPAHVGATMTLVHQSDIVINLTFSDASETSEAPRKALESMLRHHIAGAEEILPLDGRLMPSRKLTVDGNEGLGNFALVRRTPSKAGDRHAIDNPHTKDHSDWVYVAYIPGHPGGKPGESFNIEARIERFGRFAKEPAGKQMTEKQFRAMALQIMQSIHRRPGAWVAKP